MAVATRSFKAAKEMEEAALELMADGACVFSPNPRLQRRLVHEFRLKNIESGKKVWEAPRVYSLRFFIDKSYENLWREKRQLSYETSLLLWMDILDKKAVYEGLPAAAELASEFQKTFDLLEKHKVSEWVGDDEFFVSRNHLFADFKKEKERKKYITYSEAVHEIQKAIDGGEIAVFPRVINIGGDQLFPVEWDFLDCMSKKSDVTSFVLEAEHRDVQTERFNKLEDEVEVIAGRVVSEWEKGERSIGILYSENGYKERLERVFNDLERGEAPEAGRCRCNPGESFNLTDTPLYQIISMIMSLNDGILDENLFSLVSSPLCKKNILLDMNSWVELASSMRRNKSRGLKEFKRQFEFGDELDDFIEPGEFKVVDWIGKIEKAFGLFCLETEDGGYLERVNEKIGDCFRFIEIERGADVVPLNRFRAICECAASNTGIKRGGPEHTGVQIIPYKEGYGLCFDNLYILGCHQGVLPEKPMTYPLLHYKEKEQIPALSVPESYVASEVLFRAIMSGGSSVNISRAIFDKETPVLASPFLRDGSEPEDWNVYTSRNSGLLRARWLEEALAARGDPDTNNDRNRNENALKGIPFPQKMSVTALADLFSCPFRFFACHIAGIKEGSEISALADAQERGGFLHKLLEKCFDGLGGSRKKPGEDALNDRLRVIAAEEIRASDHTETEKRSLLQFFNGREGKPGLIDKWTEFEAERIREGWTYKAAETRLYGIEIQDLNLVLNGKADRIDWNDKRKELMIVDYKTGSSVKDIHRLQIAIYKKMALLKNDEDFSVPGDMAVISGGVLALGADKLRLEDCGREQEESYFQRIRGCVESIRNGGIEADPFPAAGANECPCRYCSYAALCHIKEKDGPEGETDV